LSGRACKKTGVYIAYPASPVLKSTCRLKDCKTGVNDQHTKVGIAKDSFLARKKECLDNFDNEVDFIPVAVIDVNHLDYIEARILSAIYLEFKKVGLAGEWLDTSDRQRIHKIISGTLAFSGIEYEYIG
jgi:hypothetical protein